LKKLFIIGAGGHTRAVLSTAKLMNNWKEFEILDTNFRNQKETILGVKVSSLKGFTNSFDKDNNNIFISIGDNHKREEIFKKYAFDIASFTNIIHPLSNIDDESKIGIGNFIGPFSNIGPEVEVGDFNIINSYANLEHEVSIGNFNHLAPSSTTLGRCKISNNVFVGCNSTIIENLHIAQNNFIGSGAIVIKSITEENGKYIGIPAKKI